MNKVLATIISVLISGSCFSSSGPSETILSLELASKLGFEIDVTREGPAVMVKASGPTRVYDGCWPASSAAALLDQDGIELMVYSVGATDKNVRPSTIGYTMRTENIMTIYFDYYCRSGNVLSAKRFTVPSIEQWLITSQASGTP